ncbi:hypothetical protein [Mucilaginibacter sp. BT774]|uniref:hypothetical protein n=1 Tax=Mucilaginibacter sp. BT774 TaxID=3062276 RepID=UPI002674FFFF|nr:hypothetical protein [Mucilaginibacter sp. BT774]MDO3626722.1 hypothetical protein [Mucilaginibacter sp. BT774]
MDEGLHRDRPVVRLRAFRAIDDPVACELFIEGHTHVLTSIGVTKVTSSRHEWTSNPAAFVIIVESLDGKKVYGGARVQVAGGTEPLPIEQATVGLDSSVIKLVWKYAQFGTGEICGLWNSREIAGYGIGSIFLTRAAVAISTQIGLTSLFALCAQYTVAMAQSVGYHLENSVGNSGTFYYPKMDLLATAMLHEDIETLTTAQDEDRNAILKLRESLNLIRIEVLRKKSIEIHYELKIPHLENWDLQATIANAKRTFKEKDWTEARLNLL